jgi:hypothetical protein
LLELPKKLPVLVECTTGGGDKCLVVEMRLLKSDWLRTWIPFLIPEMLLDIWDFLKDLDKNRLCIDGELSELEGLWFPLIPCLKSLLDLNSVFLIL